jgi:hypothetical protein
MKTLTRSLERWALVNPKIMLDEGSKAALFYALVDAQKDIALLGSVLCAIAYPRRGTVEVTLTLQQFADVIQAIIPFGDVANGTIRLEW